MTVRFNGNTVGYEVGLNVNPGKMVRDIDDALTAASTEEHGRVIVLQSGPPIRRVHP